MISFFANKSSSYTQLLKKCKSDHSIRVIYWLTALLEYLDLVLQALVSGLKHLIYFKVIFSKL